MNADIPIIAIDGPTASGKGTIAQRVADALGFHYLDSGALYRLAALSALEDGVALDDEVDLAAVAAQLAPRFAGGAIWLGQRDVSEAIRAEAVGVAASKIAVYPRVRQALFDLQRGFGRAPGLVADGRDMASVVFPEARLKVFLTASPEARAERRHKQLMTKGIQTKIANLARDLRERDERDMLRAAAPLAPAQGAKLLDSSTLSIDEVVALVLKWYQEA
ncbi:MAG: (d)CMP kinase [Burkholderiaceae bacterium]